DKHPHRCIRTLLLRHHITSSLPTLPLHDALPISLRYLRGIPFAMPSEKELASIIENVYMEAGFHERIDGAVEEILENRKELLKRSEEHTYELQSSFDLVCCLLFE